MLPIPIKAMSFTCTICSKIFSIANLVTISNENNTAFRLPCHSRHMEICLFCFDKILAFMKELKKEYAKV